MSVDIEGEEGRGISSRRGEIGGGKTDWLGMGFFPDHFPLAVHPNVTPGKAVLAARLTLLQTRHSGQVQDKYSG